VEIVLHIMSINLVAVRSVNWTEFDDGQIDELTIEFIPEVKLR